MDPKLTPTEVRDSAELYRDEVITKETVHDAEDLTYAVTEGPEARSNRLNLHMELLETFKAVRMEVGAALAAKGIVDVDFETVSNRAYNLLGRPDKKVFKEKPEDPYTPEQQRYALAHDPLSRVAVASLETIGSIKAENYRVFSEVASTMAAEAYRLLKEGSENGTFSADQVERIGNGIKELAVMDLTYKDLEYYTPKAINAERTALIQLAVDQENERKKAQDEHIAGWNSNPNDHSFR